MWGLDNITPFAAERMWVRDGKGTEIWVVVVKGTFLVEPDGAVSVAPHQADICRAPLYHGAPETSSLCHDTDLVRCRHSTDIILHGFAHAPHGEPTAWMDVGLRVGSLSKRLRVIGDRRWQRTATGMRATPPHPFTVMPLRYERALGGPLSPVNPAGTGITRRPLDLNGVGLPNIEDPSALIAAWSDRPTPAGFGPIAGHWSPRKELAGTFDERWLHERQPLLPSDFDERYYQCAPADQQVPGHVRGGEPVELTGMIPQGLLRFDLPRVDLGIETKFSTGRTMPQHVVVHSVILDPESRRVVMVWQSALVCHHDAHHLHTSRIFLKRRLSHPCTARPSQTSGGKLS